MRWKQEAVREWLTFGRVQLLIRAGRGEELLLLNVKPEVARILWLLTLLESCLLLVQ